MGMVLLPWVPDGREGRPRTPDKCQAHALMRASGLPPELASCSKCRWSPGLTCQSRSHPVIGQAAGVVGQAGKADSPLGTQLGCFRGQGVCCFSRAHCVQQRGDPQAPPSLHWASFQSWGWLAQGSAPGPHCRDRPGHKRRLSCLLSGWSLTLGEQSHVLRTLKQPYGEPRSQEPQPLPTAT